MDLSVLLPHFIDSSVVFNYNRRDRLDPYLMMLSPLNHDSWFLLMAISFLLSLVLYLVSRKPLADAAFDMVRISLDFSCSKFPNTQIYRFVVFLIVFLFMSLNNVYISKFYDMFQTDMKKPEPQSVNDLCSHNYVIVVKSFFSQYLEDVPEIKKGLLKVEEINTEISLLNYIKDNPKLVAVDSFEEFNYEYSFYSKEVKKTLNFLPISLRETQRTFHFAKKTMLASAVDKVVLNLLRGGIISRISKMELKRYIRRESKGCLVMNHLTSYELIGLCDICLKICALSAFIFIGELLWFPMKRFLFQLFSK